MADGLKLNKLKEYLKSLGNLAVAFSGGLDSTFLLTVAQNTPGIEVVALTLDTPYIPGREIAEAKEICAKLRIKHVLIDSEIPEDMITNPENRCYICKSLVFKSFIAKAGKLGKYQVVDGTNTDDTKDYRPGMKALQELGVKSPLLEAGFDKNDIRKFSKILGIKSWNKPANACLLTRIPYNTEISETDLRRIEKAELLLHSMGFSGARVRIYESTARIEVRSGQISGIAARPVREKITFEMKRLGFNYITLDLEGYRKGSMNINIEK